MRLFRRPVPSQTSPVPAEAVTPLAAPEWQEVGDSQLGSVITFEGLDLDEQAALEMENFERAVKTPEREDAGGAAMAHRVDAQWIVRFGLGGFLAFAGFLALPEDLRWAVEDGQWSDSAGRYAMLFLFLLFCLGAVAPSIVARIRARRARPRVRSTTHAFRLGFSSEQLVVERDGSRLALETGEILRFEGGSRLSVVRRDGPPLVLPCTLRSRTHEPLAARLNELLGEQRGYRG